MNSFIAKKVSVEEINTIIAIQEKTWEPTYRDILSQEQIAYMFQEIYAYEALYEQMMQGKQTFVLLYKQDHQPIGFASYQELEPHVFKLHKIYVLPSEQGTGAGKFLIGAVENLVKALQGERLLLNVNRYNEAKSFYEKMGYAVLHEEDIPIGPYWMNDYVLEKILI
jgi:GNAT superfamily N-acetyltransferase